MSEKFHLRGISDAALLGAEAFIAWRLLDRSYPSNKPENPFSCGSPDFCAWREGWNRACVAARLLHEKKYIV